MVIHGASSDTPMTEGGARSASWQTCAIANIIRQTPTIKSYFLRLSEPFVHIAGQHVDVRLTAPDGYVAMRSYSIASSPSASNVIELVIERLPDGEVSPFFHDVAAVATKSNCEARSVATSCGLNVQPRRYC
jgi:ferredoxin-NADP reductase